MLARFLNVADGKSKQNVLGLLERCKELPQLLSQARLLGAATGTPLAIYDVGAARRSKRLLEDINRLLAPYKFQRVVDRYLFVDSGEAPTIQISSVPCHLVPFAPQIRASTVNEDGAVDFLLSLVESRALDRLHTCPVCAQWFMAERTDQQFCSLRCSRRKHRIQNKKRWNKYMRLYRRGEKLRQKKAQLGAMSKNLTKSEIASITKDIAELEEDLRKERRHAKN